MSAFQHRRDLSISKILHKTVRILTCCCPCYGHRDLHLMLRQPGSHLTNHRIVRTIHWKNLKIRGNFHPLLYFITPTCRSLRTALTWYQPRSGQNYCLKASQLMEVKSNLHLKQIKMRIFRCLSIYIYIIINMIFFVILINYILLSEFCCYKYE